MKVHFEKGQVKQIYDFNQEAKNIFDHYRFRHDNIVIGQNNFIGKHYIESGFKLYEGKVVQVFDSRDLYELLKTGRKDIIEWEYKNNGFYINDKIFGYTLDDGSPSYDWPIVRILVLAKQFNESQYIINLSEDDIYDLTKNKIIDLKCEQYMSRISRKIIPGLKKSHKVQIRFYDDELYNVGSSIKDIGKKISHISKLESINIPELLNKYTL